MHKDRRIKRLKKKWVSRILVNLVSKKKKGVLLTTFFVCEYYLVTNLSLLLCLCFQPLPLRELLSVLGYQKYCCKTKTRNIGCLEGYL